MSIRSEFFYDSADGITKIRALRWLPDEGVTPVGLLQIVHGMQEFIDRYDAFADFCAQHGYIVFGNDMLGHGGSIRNGDGCYFGYFGRGICPGDGGSGTSSAGKASEKGKTAYSGSPLQDVKTGGHRILVSDIRTLQDLMIDQYPGLPCYMLGHSMGSFLAREFLCLHGRSLKGAVISGTAFHPALETMAGKLIAAFLGQTKGWFYRSPFLNNMAIGSLNKEFQPARTPSDWLTRDESIVDKYVADRRTQFTFTCNAYYSLFDCLNYLTKIENLRHMPKDLPILLIAGAQDPVGKDGDGPRRVQAQLQGIGCRNIAAKIYPQCRHEVLNELNKKEVWDDVLTFLKAAGSE